jgi:hypothetical protein
VTVIPKPCKNRKKLPLGWTAIRLEKRLFLLFVDRVLPAERAEFLQLDPFRMQLFIFVRSVILATARRAFKRNKVSHFTPESP